MKYVLGPWWAKSQPEQVKSDVVKETTATNATDTTNNNGQAELPTEQTSLMADPGNNYDESSSQFHSAREILPREELQRLNDDLEDGQQQSFGKKEDLKALERNNKRPPTVQEFYFSPDNPTVQRYYRFTSTPLTPIAALHKRPGGTTPRNQPQAGPQQQHQGGGVTGLLRRSAVVPSHGTDVTGEWILVSVGGRSGWARKKSPEHQYAGFTAAETFQATEGWMGNHAFLCQGKLMLGSDAPSLFFTNALLVVGALMHFFVVLPALADVSRQQQQQQQQSNELQWFLISSPFWMFNLSLLLFGFSWVFLWVSACMDPGILPGKL